jgi:hypothetical protein
MSMKIVTMFAFVVALLVGVVGTAYAADETHTGNLMCAKCALKKADAKECQDVLVVKDDEGETVEFYVTKNAVLEKFGHTCTGEQRASVTGAVTEKDGKKWITPSKMDKVS